MNKAIKTLTDWYTQDPEHHSWELWQDTVSSVTIRLRTAEFRWEHSFAIFELTTARIDIMDKEIQEGIDKLAAAAQS